MEIQLFVKSKSDGAVRSFKFPAGPPVVIGRNPEAVVPLEGSALSRDHFSIEYRNGSVYVTDTSSNGTWVNGEPVGRGKSRAITVTDLVEVAGYEINFKLLGAPEQAPTSAMAAAPARPWQGPIARVRHFVGPFGGAEKFAALMIVCTAVLTLIYFYS